MTQFITEHLYPEQDAGQQVSRVLNELHAHGWKLVHIFQMSEYHSLALLERA